MIKLAQTNLEVHPLCLGGNVFGWSANREESEQVLNYYFDNGGNFIDTADMYSQWVEGHVGGESESIIGDWIERKGNRENVVIATKVAKLNTRPGLSSKNIISACNDSLKRLRTEYIDLYYAHQDDPATPMEETLSAFSELIKAGKVRYIAASNFTPERLQESLNTSKKLDLFGFVASQDHYNFLERGFERILRPTLEKNGLSEVPYFGLARGFLSGKYRPGLNIDSVRSAGVAAYQNERGWSLLKKLEEIAHSQKTSIAAVSLAWLRAQPTVAAPIASARNLEQIKEIMPVVQLTNEELQLLTNS
jgi:aryl-alcohol dehydrogenase-like predicted oxidoreductase